MAIKKKVLLSFVGAVASGGYVLMLLGHGLRGILWFLLNAKVELAWCRGRSAFADNHMKFDTVRCVLARSPHCSMSGRAKNE